MLNSLTVGPYRVLAADPADAGAFAAFLDGRAAPELLRLREKKRNLRAVYRDTWNGRPVVVKRIVTPFTPESLCWRVLRGSYAFNLIRRLDRAAARGSRPAHDVYLAAERWAGRRVGWETYLALEWLDGPALRADWPPDAAALAGARDALRALHDAGLAHGDPNPDNFIRTAGGVRAIDVSGKPRSPIRRGMDQVLFEAKYGEAFPPHGPGYWGARALRALRVRWRGR